MLFSIIVSIIISSTIIITIVVVVILGEHKLGRIKPGRIKRAASSLQNQNYHISCFLIRPRLYASEDRRRPPRSQGRGLPSMYGQFS